MADTEQSVDITVNLPDGRPLRVLACGDPGWCARHRLGSLRGWSLRLGVWRIGARNGLRRVGVAAGIGPWRLVDPPGTNPEDRVALRLADAGDVEGALAAFKRLATQEYAAMLRLDDDTMMDEFTRPVPEKERAVFTPHMRHLWAADMREALMS